jgi:hypothetical protein
MIGQFSSSYWSDIFLHLCGLFELKMCESKISIHDLETFQGVVPDEPVVHFHPLCFGSISLTKSCPHCSQLAKSTLDTFDWQNVLALVHFFKNVAQLGSCT